MSMFRPSTPPASGEREPALSAADRATLAQLVRAGADLAEPRHVVYYCYAPSEPAARAIGDAAEARGFLVRVREPLPSYPDQWAVVAEAVAVTDAAYVATSTAFFVRLAGAFDAEYDGWEASV